MLTIFSNVFLKPKHTFLLCLIILLSSCSESDPTKQNSNNNLPITQPIESGNWYKPSINVSWQWQLNNSINKSYNVDIYDIDLFDTQASAIKTLQQSGKKVICYFSAGSYENWRSDKDMFPQESLGEQLDDWEGEKWLDITNNKLRTIMKSRLDLAVEKGCDGVEPDNVDGFDNITGFALSYQDQLEYNIFLANAARSRGLSIALKNDLTQVVALEPYFDFAVNEECNFYNECDQLLPFIKSGKPVLNVEYSLEYVNNTNQQRDSLCEYSKLTQIQTLVLPLELDDSFRYSCN